MITIELMGGLGNQLFQIFTLLAYSFDNKCMVALEDKEISVGTRKTVYWDNLLSNMQIFIKPEFVSTNLIKEKRYHYDVLPPIKNKDTNTKLVGYFQSYKYFEHQMSTINKFVKLDEKKEPYVNNYCYEYSISMHFRLGDYKKLSDYHPILTHDYYINALRHIVRVTERENWQVIYFCEDEDIEQVSKIINKIQQTMPFLSFVKIESSYTDWEQMLIMSLCRHNIIANSTFSWWGAYFNTQDNIVCYPSTWFGKKLNNHNVNDLCPTDWIRIEA